MGDCKMTHEVLCGLKKIIEENHVDLSPHRFPQIDLRTLQPDPTKFVQDHILYGRNCVFTGKLERFSRKEAAQIVLNIGGHCENNVTKNTNFLVVGNFDYCSNVKGNKTGKLKKAEGLILKGRYGGWCFRHRRKGSPHRQSPPHTRRYRGSHRRHQRSKEIQGRRERGGCQL